MRRRVASKEAVARMRLEDNRSDWLGIFRCCGRRVVGKPDEIAKAVEQHAKENCRGAQNRTDTTD